MSDSFHDELARLANPTIAAAISKGTSALAESLASILASLSSEEKRNLFRLFLLRVHDEILAMNRDAERVIYDRMLKDSSNLVAAPIDAGSITPGAIKTPVPDEIVEKARRDFDDKSTIEELTRIRETGGFALKISTAN